MHVPVIAGVVQGFEKSTNLICVATALIAFLVLQIKAASKQAGVSTASMGKFDARLPGEKPGERSLGSKRSQFAPVAAASGQEGKKVICLLCVTAASSITLLWAVLDKHRMSVL